MPRNARLPKHLLQPPSRGPYKVHSQPDPFNLILKEPDRNILVDGGAKIPLDQILAGPRRARLEFSDDSDVRPVSKLIEGTRDASSSGYLVGKRVGWGPLSTGAMVAYQAVFQGPEAKQLTIGRVLANERDRMTDDGGCPALPGFSRSYQGGASALVSDFFWIQSVAWNRC